jgi:hypothetical protein
MDPVILPCFLIRRASFGLLWMRKERDKPPAVGHIEAISAREHAMAIVPGNVMMLFQHNSVSCEIGLEGR